MDGNKSTLIKRLGDLSEWFFTGAVVDSGTAHGSACACGEAIRYEFIIAHKIDGTMAVIGSSCIRHFIDANPVEAEKMEKAHKEFKRNLKLTPEQRALESRVVELEQQYENNYKVADALCRWHEESNVRLPRWLFMTMRAFGHRLPVICPYKTIAKKAPWYAKQNIVLLDAIKSCADTYKGGLSFEEVQHEIAKVLIEKQQSKKRIVEGNLWLITVLEKQEGQFCSDMVRQLREGATLNLACFSPTQLAIMCKIFCKFYGNPKGATKWRYENALEFFNKKIRGEEVDVAMLSESAKPAVRIRFENKEGLPF